MFEQKEEFGVEGFFNVLDRAGINKPQTKEVRNDYFEG